VKHGGTRLRLTQFQVRLDHPMLHVMQSTRHALQRSLLLNQKDLWLSKFFLIAVHPTILLNHPMLRLYQRSVLFNHPMLDAAQLTLTLYHMRLLEAQFIFNTKQRKGFFNQ
jgi:hypothetical protein